MTTGIPQTAHVAPGDTNQRIWDALRDPPGYQRRLGDVAKAAGVTAGTVRSHVRDWHAAGYVAMYESGVARLDRDARAEPPDVALDCGGKLAYVSYPDEPFTTTINRTAGTADMNIYRRRRGVMGPEGTIAELRPGETLRSWLPRLAVETRKALATEAAPQAEPVDPAPPVTEHLPAVTTGADLPALLDAGQRALAQATTDLERLRVRDGARAYQEAARVLRRADVLVDASILVQTAERAIAGANPAPTPADARRRRGTISAHHTDIDIRILRRIRSAHAHVDDALFRRLVAVARTDGVPLTRQRVAQAGRDARGAPSPKVVHYSGDFEWTTPPHILGAARRVMGGIDLDPASSDAAQKVVGADKYYTAHEDGLKRAWAGRVWLNPPYRTGLVQAFTERLVEHVRAGKVSQAILLTNNSTDTAWWQWAASHAYAVCLLAGRLKFLTPSGAPATAPIQGQAACYFAAEVDDGIERFAHEFRSHGTVFYPVLTEDLMAGAD